MQEEFTLKPLKIVGKIPDWLSGTFVRNGPMPVQVRDQKLKHWFDGPAMLQAFSFQNGNVLYSNQYLRTDVYQTIFVENNLDYSGFAQVATFSFWQRIKRFFTKKGQSIPNANVNVVEIAKQTVALTEIPLPVRFDIHNLKTLGVLSFQDNLSKKDVFESAHPQIDTYTSEKINYRVEYGRKSYYVIYRYNEKDIKREIIGKIETDKPSYMHTFALTEHYIILVEFPLRVNPIDFVTSNKGFINNFHWYPEQGTRFLMIDRKTGTHIKTIQYTTPFFAFHHVNAFEKEEDIILDIVSYRDAKVITALSDLGNDVNTNRAPHPHDFEKLQLDENDEDSHLIRYTLSLKNESVKAFPLFELPVEFPRINEHYNTQAYRYIYAVDARSLIYPNDIRSIYKIDTLSKEKWVWQEVGTLPGEPVFIPSQQENKKNIHSEPKNTEDEGVVVSIVLNETQKKAFLLVLDAKNLKEIARIYAPHSIPLGLHGHFFKTYS